MRARGLRKFVLYSMVLARVRAFEVAAGLTMPFHTLPRLTVRTMVRAQHRRPVRMHAGCKAGMQICICSAVSESAPHGPITWSSCNW